MLSENAGPRGAMEAYVTKQIERLESYETDAKRDWGSAVIALVLVGLLFWAAFALFGVDHWAGDIAAWSLIVIAAAGLSSMYDSIKRIPRDEKGKPR